jgi:glycosyltransferase involved in cell wall biosynthesis
VRTGVDVEKIELLDKPDLMPVELKNTPFVFSPRFMAPIYNIEFQIETLALLDTAIIEAYMFVFIRGKQYNEVYYQQQLKRLAELKESIHLNYLVIDYLEQDEMWMLLKKAALCMMTPISDGTPNSALEAMSAKCPLILSNLDYDKDLFENTCIQLNTFEVNELKDSIESALSNYDSNRLSKAFETVKQSGNRNVEMEKLAAIYTSID